jgi:hypothetical protein
MRMRIHVTGSSTLNGARRLNAPQPSHPKGGPTGDWSPVRARACSGDSADAGRDDRLSDWCERAGPACLYVSLFRLPSTALAIISAV